MSKSVRTRSHDAVVSVLVAARIKSGLTQREVANRLPAWLGWTNTTLAKAETGRRYVSFVEVREIAKVVGTDIARVDRDAADLAAGRRASMAPKKKKRR